MSETKLSGEKVNEERAFIKRYTEGLAGRDVSYQGDFSTPLEDRPRKVAVIGVSDLVSVSVGRRSDPHARGAARDSRWVLCCAGGVLAIRCQSSHRDTVSWLYTA